MLFRSVPGFCDEPSSHTSAASATTPLSPAALLPAKRRRKFPEVSAQDSPLLKRTRADAGNVSLASTPQSEPLPRAPPASPPHFQAPVADFTFPRQPTPCGANAPTSAAASSQALLQTSHCDAAAAAAERRAAARPTGTMADWRRERRRAAARAASSTPSAASAPSSLGSAPNAPSQIGRAHV